MSVKRVLKKKASNGEWSVSRVRKRGVTEEVSGEITVLSGGHNSRHFHHLVTPRLVKPSEPGLGHLGALRG